jgi:lipoprotein-releasing system permease protein
MNAELFIARRLFSDKKNQQHISRQIINIALVSISLSLAVMIVSASIVTGFKNEVGNKAVGFGGHIQIVNFDSNNSPETRPISMNQPFLPDLKKLKFIKNIQIFATKPGIIKTDENIEGVVVKGVGADYNWDFFRKYLVAGEIPEFNDSIRVNNILISKKTSDLLNFKVGDNVYVYFISNDGTETNSRQFKVSGIFNTGLEEFDKLFIIADIKHIQRLNNWQSNQVSGFEINIDNFGDIQKDESAIRDLVINYHDNQSLNEVLRTESIVKKYPQIFDWLSILDMNVWVILVLMTLVAGINMVSGLLVLILERSSMIGIIKSLGCRSQSIRRIFLYLSGLLISRGLLWGNLIGIALIAIQKYFKLMPLNPDSYYMAYVPVNFSILQLVVLNAGTMLAVLIMLLIPSTFISKISPDKTIRFN